LESVNNKSLFDSLFLINSHFIGVDPKFKMYMVVAFLFLWNDPIKL